MGKDETVEGDMLNRNMDKEEDVGECKKKITKRIQTGEAISEKKEQKKESHGKDVDGG